MEYFSDKLAVHDNPEQIQHQFLLQQWRDIEMMLVERGAIDTGISQTPSHAFLLQIRTSS